ncbi:MAG: malonyl-CoA decarboxylase-domain-containing protein [Benniella sp.]|nr:MAG: malonyl-CoA decarboxylase-domain-containing protein [Benniella sp.]
MSKRLLPPSLFQPSRIRWLTSTYTYPRTLPRQVQVQVQIQRTMTSVNGNDKGGDPNKPDDNQSSNTGFATASAAGSGTLQALRPNLVDRYWNDIAEHFREPGFSTFDKEKSSLVTRDPEFMRKLLLAVITDRPSQGDILPSVIAKSSCDFFTALDKAGKTEFLRLLARDFGVLQDDVVKAAQQYTDYTRVEPESKALLRAEQVLRHAIVPGHNKFFDRVSRLPGGLKFLIDMRQDLLSIIQENRNDFYLSTLNESLKEKLQSWFVGFLDLERLTWQSPAVLLEKITQYEAVHKFNDFQDLKRRVGPGRRVFALMNKSLPTEPLVFVQVALVSKLSNNVQDILNDPSPGHVDPAKTVKCAIFYSITTQVGLSGIELGNFLIKRVVRSLKVEFPQIETFSTLSPIPGFRKWLVQCQKLGQKLLLPQEQPIIARLGQGSHNGDPEDQLSDILQHPSTFSDSEMMNKLRPILTRLCGRYILLEKRRYLALDPVANFHLRNGACAHRLNWLGDTSAKGMEESFGMMINYLYALDHIEMNNQQYLQDGMITVSSRDPGFDSALLHANAMTFSSSTTTSDQHSATETSNNSSATAAGRIVQLNGARFRLLDIVTA